MGSTVVNARISLAKKEAANNILESIGATPSELINSAYDYLLKHKRLPGSTDESPEERSGFSGFVADSTLEIDWGKADPSLDYREILRQGKAGDYESLAGY